MSAAATPAVPPATPPPRLVHSLDEFSDRLSPMLVKELRQGLRAKTFVILFLALQALLCVVLLSAIGASTQERAGGSVSQVIFFFFAFAVLVVQPLRGIGALHNEIKGNTIDLMVLTRLSSWRIVLGKCVAIVSQSALLLTAIAPYLILRYFFGQMNLFAELLLLALIFFGSAVFTAITVGLSAIPSILIRGLIPLVASMYVVAGIMAMTSSRQFKYLVDACSLQSDGSGWGLLAGVIGGAYFAWSALALGASMIAPMAENHSTVRRLVALAMVPLIGLIARIGDFGSDEVTALLVLVCILPVSIALTEPLQLLPPICRPFLRFGVAGRLAGRFLYPGWPTGVLFTGLLVILSLGVLLFHSSSPRPIPSKEQVILWGTLGTFLMPALILRFFGGKVKQNFAMYLLILVILITIAILLTVISSETRDDSFLWWFSWIPPVQAPLMEWVRRESYIMGMGMGGYSGTPPDYNPLILTSLICTVTYFLSLLLFAVRKFPAIREVEDAAPTATEP